MAHSSLSQLVSERTYQEQDFLASFLLLTLVCVYMYVCMLCVCLCVLFVFPKRNVSIDMQKKTKKLVFFGFFLLTTGCRMDGYSPVRSPDDGRE